MGRARLLLCIVEEGGRSCSGGRDVFVRSRTSEGSNAEEKAVSTKLSGSLRTKSVLNLPLAWLNGAWPRARAQHSPLVLQGRSYCQCRPVRGRSHKAGRVSPQLRAILKTTDGGATWFAAGSMPREINALLIDRENPNIVYAEARPGADRAGIQRRRGRAGVPSISQETGARPVCRQADATCLRARPRDHRRANWSTLTPNCRPSSPRTCTRNHSGTEPGRD